MTTFPLLGLAPAFVVGILVYAIGCIAVDIWRDSPAASADDGPEDET